MRTRTTLPSRATILITSATLVALTACESSDFGVGPGDAPAGLARSFGAWAPGPLDTCSPEIHDRYAVVGPDGKLYPTWHPPVDPDTGCTFGHEHGRDPRGSDLFGKVGFPPFGYANEVADFFAPHPGFKVEWENDVEMSAGDGAVGGLLNIRCDVLVEIHQGSAGSGRFVQPQHELSWHTRCTDGTELHMTLLSTIGHAGEFKRSCGSGEHVVVNPDFDAPDGGGNRVVPDRTCMERHILVPDGSRSNYGAALRESWQFSTGIRATTGKSLASIGPYFNVFNPSRYHDPASSDLVGAAMDLCYEVTPDGRAARGGMCEEATQGGAIRDIAWNDPRSPFDGAHRDVDINTIRLRNGGGPEVWYTDAWGKNGSPAPFPNSIEQFVAGIDNEAAAPRGPSIGRNRHYGGNGVHPPN